MKLEEIHHVSAYHLWQGEADYDVKLDGKTYEEAISKLAIFLVDQPAYPDSITYSMCYQTTIMINGKELKFTSEDIVLPHKWEYGPSIKNHPDYIIESEHQRQRRIKAQEEKAASLLAKQHAAEMEIYEKVKKRLEINSTNTK